MHQPKEFSMPRWPFFMGNVLMLVAAYFVYRLGRTPLTSGEVIALCACISMGAWLGVLPFVLEHRGRLKLIDAGALGSTLEKIQNLDHVAAQITSATNQWEVTQQSADKTAAVAKEISDRMVAELKEFAGFQQKMNDSEKATLRLEVEKLRRAEGEWLQILVRLLDHVYALYHAAERSGQENLIAQVGSFQNACRDTARRIGLVPFTAAPDEPFDAQRHKWADGEKVASGAIVSETVATGFTFQSRLVRPALVRLRNGKDTKKKADDNQLELGTHAPVPPAVPEEPAPAADQ
jgi:molecular chaperone GrpE (heat shock protein)